MSTCVVHATSSKCNKDILPKMMLCSAGWRTTMNSIRTVFFLLLSWMHIDKGSCIVPSNHLLCPMNPINLLVDGQRCAFHSWGNCINQCSYIFFQLNNLCQHTAYGLQNCGCMLGWPMVRFLANLLGIDRLPKNIGFSCLWPTLPCCYYFYFFVVVPWWSRYLGFFFLRLLFICLMSSCVSFFFPFNSESPYHFPQIPFYMILVHFLS